MSSRQSTLAMWSEAQDSEGRKYYYNQKTQETSWEKPAELMTQLEKLLLQTNWKTYQSEDGKPYYYNETTQESSWDVPEEVQKMLGDSKPVVLSTGETSESKILNVQPSDDGEELFMEMLREHAIDATWSFVRIVKLCIQDPRYWALGDPVSKKQVFEKYLNSRSKEELLRESASLEKFHEAFIKLLQSYKEIKHYTRWPTARMLIADEPIYVHSVIPESKKREAFLEYIAGLQQEHETVQAKKRDQALSELREYFKSIVNEQCQWVTFHKNLKDDVRFKQNKHFEVLHELDLANEYMKIMESIVQEKEAILSVKQAQNYSVDRVARDKFKELLQELLLKRTIRCTTTWQDVFPLVEKDQRFLNMVGRNGSSPVDLFYNIIDDLEIVMRGYRDMAMEFLVKGTMEDLVPHLKSKIPQLDDQDIETIIDRVRKAQLDLEAKELQRKERDFSYSLRKLNITPNSQWHEFKDRFADQLDESTCERLFNEYVAGLGPSRKRPAVALDY